MNEEKTGKRLRQMGHMEYYAVIAIQKPDILNLLVNLL